MGIAKKNGTDYEKEYNNWIKIVNKVEYGRTSDEK